MVKITVKQLADELGLRIICPGRTGEIEVVASDINRPGLQLCGDFDCFANERFQILGKAEMTHMNNLPHNVLKSRLHEYFKYDVPCVLIGRGMTPPDCLVQCAREHGVPLMVSESITGQLIHDVTAYLDAVMAPCISRHGGLMDIHGVGVFITGDSGIGKSETMLELVQRGHRLVADDVVDIKKVGDYTLIGSAPDVIRYLMEIRGLGLIDVSVLYGTGAVMLEKELDMNIHLNMGEVKGEARLGPPDESIDLLGIKIPKITLPVKVGRNIAIIIEVAARLHRLRIMGHDPENRLDSRILDLLR